MQSGDLSLARLLVHLSGCLFGVADDAAAVPGVVEGPKDTNRRVDWDNLALLDLLHGDLRPCRSSLLWILRSRLFLFLWNPGNFRRLLLLLLLLIPDGQPGLLGAALVRLIPQLHAFFLQIELLLCE